MKLLVLLQMVLDLEILLVVVLDLDLDFLQHQLVEALEMLVGMLLVVWVV